MGARSLGISPKTVSPVRGGGYSVAMLSASLPVLLGCALAGLGLYLCLPPQPDRRLRIAGAVLLAAASLCLLGLFLRVSAESADAGGVTLEAAAWVVLSAASLAAAVLAVVNGSALGAVKCYGGLLLANTLLMLLLGAPAAAAVMVLVAGSAAAPLWRLARSPGEGAEPRPREPLLACVTATLLGAVLIGTIELAMATEIGREAGTDRRPALPSRALVRDVLDRRPPGTADPQSERTGLSAALFGRHLIEVLLIATLLPVATVSTVLLCRAAESLRATETVVATTDPQSGETQPSTTSSY